MNSDEQRREDAEILSELFRGSKEPRPDFVNGNGDPLDELYRQAVAAAKEYGWSVPSRSEFEARYKKEMAGKIQQ